MNFKQLLELISDPHRHAQWLNTLSLMENAGARKISANEHPTDVRLVVLKHAAEEHRHAFYLKKQIAKLGQDLCPTYAEEHLLAPIESRHYLPKLDIQVCKYLKSTLELSGYELKFAAYLLVTYAIEVRADSLYPVYQKVLDTMGSKVNVKAIIAEEEGHLEEMLQQLTEFSPQWKVHADKALEIEHALFNKWMEALVREIMVPVE